ncbi:hypothetical protein DH2020_012618 [Rehmannia glutinosa]|uniref:Gibberellin 20 oxidase n=1 Tax=Rehmannia glutinosa TaxID=99300 RepID=A0ABR0X0L1_REHGL
MDSSATTLILCPKLQLKNDRSSENDQVLVFDTTLFEKQPNLPTQFMWPHEDLPYGAQDELNDPPVDLKGFLNGNQESIDFAAAQIRTACLDHGFFQVINHGVDTNIVQSAHEKMDAFFNLTLTKKLSIKRKPGGLCGYSGAHADRFSSKLPWKETLSFTYKHANEPATGLDVVNYIKYGLGKEFEEAGYVYQKYCEAMKKLSLSILELLAISLGVDRSYYRKFFEDGRSVMRGNNYPPCERSFVSPCKHSALSNGRYKSCLHRAVVNKEKVRRSLVFFVNPKEDKIVRPPQDLMQREEARKYPDFTWLDLQEFTQNHYRADTTTLQNFCQDRVGPRGKIGPAGPNSYRSLISEPSTAQPMENTLKNLCGPVFQAWRAGLLRPDFFGSGILQPSPRAPLPPFISSSCVPTSGAHRCTSEAAAHRCTSEAATLYL